ncbi:hemerythrin domain-containing protein [Variovorax sp. OV329]|uniref:hemerythrin domain-containing protein n=1 Tax=Variovorax sp. OV329 TaxID=1882825 RepID=UPI0008EE29A9|nr:hemerythrin domain-containing protein [Variovorax sp. OV329]SFM39035.1 Hemerythrin HHE cation binding domain-containing protein [Variovorax sp. OV329]
MKNDSRELQQVESAAASAAIQAPRVDLYAGIHKALRALLADTLVAVGRMDCDDALELAQTTQRVLQLLDFMRSHLRHENEFIHPALEARAPGASGVIANEHEEHEAEIAALATDTSALLVLQPAERPAAVLALYRRLSLFVAHNYEHMHVEETAHNAVLWARYTDEELIALHNALVASIPPEEMMFAMRWMVPFMNPQERAGMLSDMRANAPAPAFAAVLAMVRPHLGAREWEKLMASLGMPLEG